MAVADAYWAGVLLSHLDGVMVEAVEDGPGGLRISARTIGGRAACPGCGSVSGRVHSCYERRLADGAIGERAVEIRLVVRRFRCTTSWCGRATFVEQVDGLTFRYGRRSRGLQSLLSTVALMLVGRAGARLAEALCAPVSRSTLVRLIRALPEVEAPTPRVLGVDLSRSRDYADWCASDGRDLLDVGWSVCWRSG